MNDCEIAKHPSDADFQEKWLELAFEEARSALKEGEVPVGCVFVGNGEVVAKGRNTVNKTKNATRHAEINCIDQIESKSGVYDDIDVYVNLEPCIMCAAALIRVKVRKVFYGPPNPRFGGCGTVLDVQACLSTLSEGPKTKFFGGYRAEEAVGMLKEFYLQENPNAPEDKRKPRKD